jgi:ribosome production factor 1
MVPKTIESMREYDETTVAKNQDGEDNADEETEWDITNDEFKDYFDKTYVPKVLITSADNPHTVSLV